MNALQIILWISWGFLGFIAMGVLSACWIERYTFDHWAKIKVFMRTSAIILGPLLFLPVIAYLIYAITIAIGRDRISIWELPDWLLTGFRTPPSKPKESTLDSPTVSP